MANSLSTSKTLLATGLLALVLGVSTVYLVHYYGETRPTTEDMQAGRTHAVRIHERTVYLTSGEYGLAMASHVIAIIAIGIFVGLVLRSRRRNHKLGSDA